MLVFSIEKLRVVQLGTLSSQGKPKGHNSEIVK